MATKDERLAYGFGDEFLSKHGAIRALVNRAVENEYTMQRFLDELRDTPWWQNKSDAQRRYQLQQVQNPAELEANINTARRSVYNLSIKLGVYLTSGQVANIARNWVKNDLSEAEVRDLVGRKYRRRSGGALRRGEMGVAGTARVQLDEMVREYGMKFSGKWLNGAARNIARGRRSVGDYEGYIREQAARKFKAIAPDIREGRTVREILEPYMQVAADELGHVAPTMMNTTYWKWNKPVSGDKQMTMDEWVRTLRGDKRYGYDRSRNATRQASILAREMMSKMGAS